MVLEFYYFKNEFICTLDCIIEVAAKTLDEEVVDAVLEVAKNYEMTELEEAMDLIREHTTSISKDLLQESVECPYMVTQVVQKEVAKDVAKGVKLLAKAFSLDAVKRVGPSCREEQIKRIGHFQEYQLLYERTLIFDTFNDICRLVSRTKSVDCVEMLVEAYIEKVAYFAMDNELARIHRGLAIGYTIGTGDSEAVRMMIDYMRSVKTFLQREDITRNDITNHHIYTESLCLFNLVRVNHDPDIVKKAIEVAFAYKDSQYLGVYTFSRAVESVQRKDVVLTIGNDLLERAKKNEGIHDIFTSV